MMMMTHLLTTTLATIAATTTTPLPTEAASPGATVNALLLYLSTQIGDSAVRTTVQIPLLLIFLDLLTGAISSIKRGTFDTRRLSDFVGQDLTKYIVCFLMVLSLSILFGAGNPYSLIGLVPMGTLAVSVAGSIITNTREIFPGDTVLVDAVEHELSGIVPGFTATPPATAPVITTANTAPALLPPSVVISPPPAPIPFIPPTQSVVAPSNYDQLVQSLDQTRPPVV